MLQMHFCCANLAALLPLCSMSQASLLQSALDPMRDRPEELIEIVLRQAGVIERLQKKLAKLKQQIKEINDRNDGLSAKVEELARKAARPAAPFTRARVVGRGPARPPWKRRCADVWKNSRTTCSPFWMWKKSKPPITWPSANCVRPSSRAKCPAATKRPKAAHTWEILTSLAATCVQQAESFAQLVGQAALLSTAR
jgi:hypothetical protein